MILFYRVLIAIFTTTIGTAFATWFFKTRIGRWFQTKIENFMSYLSEKYDIELTKKEDKWRRDYPFLANKIDELEKKVNE